ncbi:YicC/YloC family endoribonuclease [Rubrivirga sp. SAORIC476]|uniref:YicC/YloC family endoribonuclease n=1 Tax=Rubrivirga sp. SAORIC476 TaxID=1961794 RepID=UPI0013041D8D|nr:YicC/YloC family endoribonuclease [Rubrivirga sp. SAORIC476]
MTGFGRGTAREGAADATVEVRTVNGRYAEVTVRGLGDLAEHEAAVQSLVKDAIERGNATVHVTLATGAASGPLQVDTAAASALGALLRHAAAAAGLAPESVTVADLLRAGDVLVPAPPDPAAAEAAWAAVRAALAEALTRLDAMRQAEGTALADDLGARLDALDALTAEVEARAPVRLEAARQRLRDRLTDLVDVPDLDPGRLETEAVLLSDKLDVTEETVRLRSHLEQVREALAAPEPVGRRLNFLSQEIGREVNTIGSKANDAEITRLSVSMKEELEKIREQVQNVV